MINQKTHPAIEKALKLKKKFMNRLRKLDPADFDRPARYEAAVERQSQYLKRLTKILSVIVREYDVAISVQSHLDFEHLHKISMQKLYCIAAGGGKWINGKWVPITSAHNDEVQMLVERFFERRFRGTQKTGYSKWAVKPVEKLRFNSIVIELLRYIHDNNPQQFHFISQFLIDESDDFDKEIIFDVESDVDENTLDEIRDAILRSV